MLTSSYQLMLRRKAMAACGRVATSVRLESTRAGWSAVQEGLVNHEATGVPAGAGKGGSEGFDLVASPHETSSTIVKALSFSSVTVSKYPLVGHCLELLLAGKNAPPAGSTRRPAQALSGAPPSETETVSFHAALP
jgi:hypothetical protein